jgi:two-component system, NarL family, invasion response regulator UvrY
MLTIYILDDHSIVTLGISILVEEVVGKCTITCGHTKHDFINWMAKKEHTDWYILDINIPHFSCLDAIDQIKLQDPEAQILILTMNSEAMGATHYYQKGIDAYIHKNSSDAVLKAAFATVFRGLKYYSQEYRLLNDLDASKQQTNPFKQLSHREYELVELLVQGNSISDVKKMLSLHSSTIHTFKSRVFQKLNVENNIELVDLFRFHFGNNSTTSVPVSSPSE